jgi:DHA3 family macrolide efflux protein-like MFS transporter
MLSRRFHFLWITQSLSGFGDVLYILSIVTALYERSGSAAAASLFPLMRVAAMTLGGLAAPLAVDRFRLSLLLTGCLAGQSLLFGGLSLYLGIVGNDSEIPILIGFVFAISCFEGAARPVRFALVPRLVGKNKLLKANSMMAAAEQVIGLASWGMGGLLLAALSTFAAIRFTFILQMAAFAVSIWIREEASYFEAQKAAEEKIRWSALREGWTYAFRHPILRLLLTMDAWEGLFGSVFAGAFLLVFVQEQLHRGEAWWGWLNAAYFLGLICGSALMGRYFARKGSALTGIMIAGSGLYGLLTFAFAWTTQPWLAAALVGGLGIVYPLRDLSQRSLFQTHASAQMLPKALAAQSTFITALYGVSLLLSGWLADVFGIRTLYLFAAGSFFISFAIAFAIKRDFNQVHMKSGG